jgi:hypothetical protein
MNIRQAVFGQIAINPREEIFDVDVGALLRRLLLFETVIVESLGLRETAALVRTFGKAGFLHLFNSGILKISAEFTFLITDIAQNGVRTLPLSHFSFGVATLSDRKVGLRRGLTLLQGVPGLKNQERIAMEEILISGLTRPGADYGAQLQAQVESDIRNNTPALAAAIREQLHKRFGAELPAFALQVEEVSERAFHVISDLPTVFRISDEETHRIMASSVSAVANLNQRLANMAAYSAIVGFTENEAPLLFGKLAGVIGPQNPQPLEQQFSRVMTLANVPEFPRGKRVDVDVLVKVRDSVECREFRSWLANAATLTDKEVEEMTGGFRSKVGSMIRSSAGKALRFAVTTILGFGPHGIVIGPASGAVDSFLVERVFPNPGVLAFLTELYPSLFKSP